MDVVSPRHGSSISKARSKGASSFPVIKYGQNAKTTVAKITVTASGALMREVFPDEEILSKFPVPFSKEVTCYFHPAQSIHF